MNPFHCSHHEKKLAGASAYGTFFIAFGGLLFCLATLKLHIYCNFS